MIGKMVVLITISAGGWTGWALGSPGGIMGSYLAAVLGASIGLYIGRRLEERLAGDD